MFKPNLFIIAGCNGAGKSTYSKNFLPEGLIAFDADYTKKQLYDAFSFDFELRELMAWNKTYAQLKSEVEVAIEQNKDFAYETNFNHEPLHWLNKFKKAGYLIHLIYFCLESAELAIQRVAIRFQNGGHYVPDAEVNERYTAGFNNLDNYYDEFNAVLVIDGSSENQKPKTLFLCDLDSGVKQIGEILPGYFKRQCQQLSNFLLNTLKRDF